MEPNCVLTRNIQNVKERKLKTVVVLSKGVRVNPLMGTCVAVTTVLPVSAFLSVLVPSNSGTANEQKNLNGVLSPSYFPTLSQARKKKVLSMHAL